MKRKILIIVGIVLALALITVSFLFMFGKDNKNDESVEQMTYAYLEDLGYTENDIEDIEVEHSYINKLLGYNEWRIFVEFESVSDIIFAFTYRNKKIIMQGIKSEKSQLSIEKIEEYRNNLNNGKLKADLNDLIGNVEPLSNGVIQFYNEPTAENKTAIIDQWATMTKDDFNLFLEQIKNQKWVDDEIVDRLTYYYDCRIAYDDFIYIGYDQKVIYYKKWFTELTDENAALIKSYYPNDELENTDNTAIESLVPTSFEVVNNYSGISLEVVPNSLNDKSLKINIINNTDNEVTYDMKYYIEVKKDGKWYTLNYDQSFQSLAKVQNPKSSSEFTIKLPYILETGNYRIIKTITSELNCSVEFDVN